MNKRKNMDANNTFWYFGGAFFEQDEFCVQ